jgi:nicotinamidase/pyrazinamidase
VNALLVVDVQNDFCPGGALAVPEGDQVVPVINRLMPCFDLVVATQDWHPPDHGSFAANHPGKQPGDVVDLDGLDQILWPVHCVQGTPGAEFHPGLRQQQFARIFRKGTDPRIDSYSGLFDNGRRKATGLGDYLRRRGIRTVHIAGLTTDYCVQYTALDAVELGFRTLVVEDACRGVNLKPGDVDRAILAMRAAGVEITSSREIVSGQG